MDTIFTKIFIFLCGFAVFLFAACVVAPLFICKSCGVPDCYLIAVW